MELFSVFWPCKNRNEKANLLQNSEECVFCNLETEGFITVLELKPSAEHPAFSHWSADGAGKRLPSA